MLDPITPQYIADLVAWAAIGARTTESQTHREMASGLSMPVGFKNTTEGNLQAAVNAIQSARRPHSFLGITQEGMSAVIRTSGNPDTHVVLRGGRKPNYDAASIEECRKILAAAALEPRMMVDCSHAQTSKDYTKQPEVLRTLVDQVCAGSGAVMGAMLESNLEAGSQPLSSNRAALKYGVSITDPCIDWPTTEQCLLDAAEALASTSESLLEEPRVRTLADRRIAQRLGIYLFAIASIVFVLSPVWVLGDSNYSMLLSENIIRNHSSYLNGYQFPEPIQENGRCASPTSRLRSSFLTYQLDRVRGNIVYCYPNGTSILSIPFVALMNLLGVHCYGPDGRCLPLGEGIIQRLLAALLMAGFTVIVFNTATQMLGGRTEPGRCPSRRIRHPGMEHRVASDGIPHLADFLRRTGRVLHVGARDRPHETRHPIALATLVSWMYLVRPTGAIPVLCVTIYVFTFWRSDFLAYSADRTGLVRRIRLLFVVHLWKSDPGLLSGLAHRLRKPE